MTKEQWKKVEDWWGTGPGHVEMDIDGHKITLYNVIDKKRMIVEVCVYVDGCMRTGFSKAGDETGDRFWQRIKKSLYSAKELKDRARAFGKRSDMAKQKHLEYNVPAWRSLRAFKRHITAHNTDIKLISCGWEEMGATDAKDA